MTRERLPNRRGSYNVDIVRGHRRFTAGFSFFPETTRVAEIFLSVHRDVGQDLEGVARDGLILASFALQHGAGLEELIAAMSQGHDGAPASILGELLAAVAGAVGDLKGGDGEPAPATLPQGPAPAPAGEGVAEKVMDAPA